VSLFAANGMVERLCFPPTLLHRIGLRFYYNIAAECCNIKKLHSRLLSTKSQFYQQNQRNGVFAQPFGDLGITCAFHLYLVGKRVIDSYKMNFLQKDLRTKVYPIRRFVKRVGRFEAKC